MTGGEGVTAVADDTVAAFAAPIAQMLTSREAWQISAQRSRAQGTQLQWPTDAGVLLDAYHQLTNSRVDTRAASPARHRADLS